MTIDTASIIISAVSLLTGITISVIAIALSVYFYHRSTESSTNTAKSLTKIDTQIDQLKGINDKLLSRALGSLSSIAKQKATSADSELHSQAMAALRVAATIASPEKTASATSKEHTAPKTVSAEPGNQIADHELPDLPDPLTLADLKRQYVLLMCQTINVMGWANNYGQQALLLWATVDDNGQINHSDPLIRETALNLDNTANIYRAAIQTFGELKADQPELFRTNPNATKALASTRDRLDNTIRNYSETLSFFYHSPVDPGTIRE